MEDSNSAIASSNEKEMRVIYLNSIFDRREYYTTPRMASIIKNHFALINQFSGALLFFIIYGLMLYLKQEPSLKILLFWIISLVLADSAIKSFMLRKYRKLLKTTGGNIGIIEYLFKLKFPDKKALIHSIVYLLVIIVFCLLTWSRLSPDERIWSLVLGAVLILTGLFF
jgi:hypothetical protein